MDKKIPPFSPKMKVPFKKFPDTKWEDMFDTEQKIGFLNWFIKQPNQPGLWENFNRDAKAWVRSKLQSIPNESGYSEQQSNEPAQSNDDTVLVGLKAVYKKIQEMDKKMDMLFDLMPQKGAKNAQNAPLEPRSQGYTIDESGNKKSIDIDDLNWEE